MLIRIPASIGLAQLELFAQQIAVTSDLDIEFEFETGPFDIHPVALCMAAALANRTVASGASSLVQVMPVSPEALNSMQFFENVCRPDLADPSTGEPAGSHIPISQILDNKALNAFCSDFVPLLHTTPDRAEAVRYVLFELIRNVIEHAGSDQGAYAAARITEDGVLQVGVADSGIGVKRSIQRAHAAETDEKAISLAFQPGVSGVARTFAGDDTNGGAGLFFMKAMATTSRQQMVMLTGTKMLRLEVQDAPVNVSANLSDDRVSWHDLLPPFNGTAVGIDLSMGEGDDFEKLFASILTVYQLSTKAKKRARNRARFT